MISNLIQNLKSGSVTIIVTAINSAKIKVGIGKWKSVIDNWKSVISKSKSYFLSLPFFEGRAMGSKGHDSQGFS